MSLTSPTSRAAAADPRDRGGPAQPMLIVDRLRKYFPIRAGLLNRKVAEVKAVDDVSFFVVKGETLGVVGESGCGKSTLARLVMHLITRDEGRLVLDGDAVGEASGLSLDGLRRAIQMVFQDSSSSLNPRLPIEQSIAYGARVQGASARVAKAQARSLMEKVGLNPQTFGQRYPHELSGGQKQRVNIARALSLDPRLLILDEAVSALDKSVEAQVLNLLADLKKQLNLTYIFISHDLHVVRYISDRVLVMVSRRGRGDRTGGKHLRSAEAPLHRGAARLPPAHGPRARASRRRRWRAIRRAPSAPRPAAVFTRAANSPRRCARSRSRGSAICWASPPTGIFQPATCRIRAPATAAPQPLEEDQMNAFVPPDQTRAVADAPFLQVRDLRVKFVSREATVRAVNGVTFDVERGKVLCVIGESGSGKSVMMRSLLRLLPKKRAVVEGQMIVGERDIGAQSEREMTQLRGSLISMVFQEPMTALDPLYTVGEQIAETVRRHENLSAKAAMQRALELLEQVRVPSPERRLKAYPHELSGGLRQRVVIAMALSCRPSLLLADEPTTALDASVQIQILVLLRKLQQDLGMSMIFVTHDLGVAAQIADQVAVMYAGRIIEYGQANDVLMSPQHPYTRAMLAATAKDQSRDKPLEAIGGSPPDLRHLPEGCAFAPRCAFAVAQCGFDPARRDGRGRPYGALRSGSQRDGCAAL